METADRRRRNCCLCGRDAGSRSQQRLRPDQPAEDSAQGERTILLDELQRQENFFHRGVPSETHLQDGTRAGGQVLMPQELFIRRFVTVPSWFCVGKKGARGLQPYAILSALNALTS